MLDRKTCMSEYLHYLNLNCHLYLKEVGKNERRTWKTEIKNNRHLESSQLTNSENPSFPPFKIYKYSTPAETEKCSIKIELN